MIASGGVFLGKRILSAKWVENSKRVKAIANDFSGDFNYGYHIWTAKRGDEHLFNGMLGQNVWICPSNDIIVVMLSGNNELFGASPALAIVRKHLGGRINDNLDRRDSIALKKKELNFFNSRRWVVPKEKSDGLLYRLGIKRRETFDDKWDDVLGKYRFPNNNLGMLPLIVRVMQNNLCSSVEEICLRREGEALFLDYIENGSSFSIKIGLYGYETNIINVRGEYYIVKAVGRAIKCEAGEIEYRVEIIASETASTRRLIIRKIERGIKLEFSESPSQRVIENIIDHYSRENRKISLGVDIIERRLGEGAISDLLHKIFNPVLIGADLSVEGYAEIIERENMRTSEELKRSRVLRALVDRFFGNDSENEISDDLARGDKGIKKTLSMWIDKISGKNRKNEINDN